MLIKLTAIIKMVYCNCPRVNKYSFMLTCKPLVDKNECYMPVAPCICSSYRKFFSIYVGQTFIEGRDARN